MLLLKQFSDLVNHLNETSGTNAKLEVLKSVKDNAQLVELIKILWDPNTTTGVTSKGIETYIKSGKMVSVPKEINLNELFGTLEMLTSRKLTGDAAKSTCAAYIDKYAEYKELLLEIFEKKPRVRLGAKLILDAFPGIYTVFKVALAQEYDHVRFEKELALANKKCFISKKYDGVRVICQILQNGTQIKFYSREGSEFVSLEKVRIDISAHIVPQLTPEELSDGIVFDGEIMAFDSNGKENFKETVSQIKNIREQMPNPRYFVFDYMRMPVFLGQANGHKLSERLEDLNELIEECPKLSNIEIVEQALWSPDQFIKWQKKAAAENWEGLMLRFDSLYEAKRTYKLMKWKFMHDGEFPVIDTIIEDMPFPNSKGGETRMKALSAVRILLEGKYKVKVGSGFSKSERLDFAANPEKILGKQITVKYQEIFTDSETGERSLRCPIFKAIRE
jgi:hypothetical protein